MATVSMVIYRRRWSSCSGYGAAEADQWREANRELRHPAAPHNVAFAGNVRRGSASSCRWRLTESVLVLVFYSLTALLSYLIFLNKSFVVFLFVIFWYRVVLDIDVFSFDTALPVVLTNDNSRSSLYLVPLPLSFNWPPSLIFWIHSTSAK